MRVDELSKNERDIVFTIFLSECKRLSEKGQVTSYKQILDMLFKIAVIEGFIECPYCKKG